MSRALRRGWRPRVTNCPRSCSRRACWRTLSRMGRIIMASTLAFIAIFITVVGAVVIGYMTTPARRQRLAPPVTESEETAGPSLVEQVAARQPPVDWQGRVDRRFDRLVHNTMLGVSGEQATAIILLT